MEDVALFGHLLGALGFVAGIVLAGAAFERARRSERPAEIAALLSLSRTGALLVLGGAALLLGCGLWLVGLEDDVDSSTGWVGAAFALFCLALALGGLGGRRPRRARELAARSAATGETTAGPELRALLDDAPSRLANYTAGALVVAILALMVFKP